MIGACFYCGRFDELCNEGWGAAFCEPCIEHAFELCDWCKRPWPPDVLDGFSGHGSFCPPCYDDAASFYREMAAEDVGVFDDDEAV